MFRKQTMFGKEVNGTIESLSHLFFGKKSAGKLFSSFSKRDNCKENPRLGFYFFFVTKLSIKNKL